MRERTPPASCVPACAKAWSRRRNGVRNASVWQRVLGLVGTVIEGIDFDEDADAVVVSAAPQGCPAALPTLRTTGALVRPREGRRRWRGLDVGTVRVLLEARRPSGGLPDPRPHRRAGALGPPRRWPHLRLRRHRGLVGGEVLEDGGRGVHAHRLAHGGGHRHRVSADIDARVDRLCGLRRIGIDEISYKRGAPLLDRGGRP